MFLKVTGNLLCGSGGGEGAGKANDDHVLSLGVLGDVDGLRVREALEELGGGELVTGGDVEGSGGAGVRHRGRESGGAAGQSGGKEELHGCGLGLYPTTSSNFGSKVVWWLASSSSSKSERCASDADRRSTDVLATAYPSQAALQPREIYFRDCFGERTKITCVEGRELDLPVFGI